MKGLTVNDCALILCIIGTPNKSGGKLYPTVEESLNYMMGKTNSVFKEEETEYPIALQLEFSFFS